MSEQDVFLICVAGLDRGKRLAIRDDEVVLGRSTHCHLLSDDREVADQHVTFTFNKNLPHFQTLDDSAVFVDGHRES